MADIIELGSRELCRALRTEIHSLKRPTEEDIDRKVESWGGEDSPIH